LRQIPVGMLEISPIRNIGTGYRNGSDCHDEYGIYFQTMMCNCSHLLKGIGNSN
jgi:hypothetical protein